MSERPESGEKTEEPTPKRRQDAAKKGERPRSKELGTALVTLSGAAYLALAGPALANACAEAVRMGLTFSAEDVTAFTPATLAWQMLSMLALPLTGLMLACIVGAVAGGALLGGAGFNAGLLTPKLNRLDPLTGLKRMFGLQGLIELGKSLLKVAVVGGIAVWAISSLGREFMALAREDLGTAIGQAGWRSVWLLLLLSGGLLLIAVVDVPITLVRFLSKLRMTRQEVKDEHKEQEGSPELKGALRRRQREARRGGVAAAVASAQVVLVNPTHFAVALRYRRAQDRAPVVVARGRGAIAAAIRAAATERRLPVLEYPLLARALYFTSREGAEIQEDLYLAVASILAFVFSLDRGGVAPVPPVVDVPRSAWFGPDGRPLSA